MEGDKELTAGERIATAIVDYHRSTETRYALRTEVRTSAYKNLVRVIDDVLQTKTVKAK